MPTCPLSVLVCTLSFCEEDSRLRAWHQLICGSKGCSRKSPKVLTGPNMTPLTVVPAQPLPLPLLLFPKVHLQKTGFYATSSHSLLPSLPSLPCLTARCLAYRICHFVISPRHSLTFPTNESFDLTFKKSYYKFTKI